MYNKHVLNHNLVTQEEDLTQGQGECDQANQGLCMWCIMHDPTISVEGNRFLFAGFQPWGAGGTPAQSPVLPQDPALPLLPTRPKACPEVPHLLSVLKPAAQTVFHPLWKAHSWVSESPSSHSSSLLQDLGYVVLSLHAVVQEHMCRVALDHGGVQGGTHFPSEQPVLMSFREAEVSIPAMSHKSVLGSAGS